jgi:hypothetical protein
LVLLNSLEIMLLVLWMVSWSKWQHQRFKERKLEFKSVIEPPSVKDIRMHHVCQYTLYQNSDSGTMRWPYIGQHWANKQSIFSQILLQLMKPGFLFDLQNKKNRKKSTWK